MSFLLESNLFGFHCSVIGAVYGKSAEEYGLMRKVSIFLFVNMDWIATRVSTATLCGRIDYATDTLLRQMPNEQPVLCSR